MTRDRLHRDAGEDPANDQQLLDFVAANREQLERYIAGFVAVHPEDLPPDYRPGMRLSIVDAVRRAVA